MITVYSPLFICWNFKIIFLYLEYLLTTVLQWEYRWRLLQDTGIWPAQHLMVTFISFQQSPSLLSSLDQWSMLKQGSEFIIRFLRNIGEHWGLFLSLRLGVLSWAGKKKSVWGGYRVTHWLDPHQYNYCNSRQLWSLPLLHSEIGTSYNSPSKKEPFHFCSLSIQLVFIFHFIFCSCLPQLSLYFH